MNSFKILAVAASMLTLPAFAQGPKLKEVNIVSMKATGDGCPAGSYETLVTPQNAGSDNADYFQIVYDKFEIHSGPDVSRGDRSTRCNLTLKLQFPKGYRFKFEHSAFGGSGEFAGGLTAEFKTNYRRPQEKKFSSKTIIAGPFEGDFDIDETKARSGGIFSGCEGEDIIQIEGMIRFKGDKKLVGHIYKDIQSGSLIQKHRFLWERC